MFGGRIFFDAIRWKKWVKRQKCLDDGSHMVIVTFVQFFLIQKLTSIFQQYASMFMEKKNWTKVIMIMWNPLSKHFYSFAHFCCMCRVLRRKKCVPLSVVFAFCFLFAVCSAFCLHICHSFALWLWEMRVRDKGETRFNGMWFVSKERDETESEGEIRYEENSSD